MPVMPVADLSRRSGGGGRRRMAMPVVTIADLRGRSFGGRGGVAVPMMTITDLGGGRRRRRSGRMAVPVMAIAGFGRLGGRGGVVMMVVVDARFSRATDEGERCGDERGRQYAGRTDHSISFEEHARQAANRSTPQAPES